MIILCHKCSGILGSTPDENTSDLCGCGCISGYIRGFEPQLTREQAIEAQIKRQDDLLELYTAQERGPSYIDGVKARRRRLEQLIGGQPS